MSSPSACPSANAACQPPLPVVLIAALADSAIRFRYGVLAAMLLFILGSVGLMASGHVRMEAMPEIDGDVLEARVLMPQGTPLQQTQAITDRITAAMHKLNEEYTPEQPDQQALLQNIQTRFNQHAGAGEKGAHVATVMVDLLTAERRTVDLVALTDRWYQEIGEIPGLIALNIQEPGFGPAGIPIEVRLQGTDLDELKAAARFLSAEVASQVRTGLLGDIVDTVQIGDQHIEILVRQTSAEERQWSQVTRIDGLRTVTVSADVNGRLTNADAIVADLQSQAFPKLLEQWPQISLQVEGQTANSRETGQSIARGLLIGLLGIFLILSFQFRSYLEPSLSCWKSR